MRKKEGTVMGQIFMVIILACVGLATLPVANEEKQASKAQDKDKAGKREQSGGMPEFIPGRQEIQFGE